MPRGWAGIFALRGWVSWREIGIDREGMTRLGVEVCAMGWKYATALCQAAHRKMVLLGFRIPCPLPGPGSCTSLPGEAEVRRDRPFPVNGCACATRAWSIYIDNFDLWEVLDAPEAEKLVGSTSSVVAETEKCYAVWNSPGSSEDHHDCTPSMQTLGVVNDGIAGRRDVPPECYGKIVSLVRYAVTHDRRSKRDMQVIAGRLLRFILRNRATAVSLDDVWRSIARWRGRHSMGRKVTVELLSALCLLPLCYIDLRLQVCSLPSCTDASYKGGGSCVGVALTPRGRRKARRLKEPQEHVAASELGLLSLFCGIGGLGRAFELLEVPVAAFISVELEGDRRRVCKAAYPHVVHHADVTQVGKADILRWRARFPRLRVLVTGGGFPCRDMSRLRGKRRKGT